VKNRSISVADLKRKLFKPNTKSKKGHVTIDGIGCIDVTSNC
jgi:hypothetical protein